MLFPDVKNTAKHMMRKYQQCTRCVMDTSDEDIFFDANGFCNHCTEYFEFKTKQLAAWTTKTNSAVIAEKIKKSGKGKKYDCVLGISGGIDSCYTAYILKEMGVRVLAVHMDNGWDSDISVRNIRYTVDKLGMGYESFVLDWQEFKDLQVSFLKASVPEMETPTDIAITAALHIVAAKYNIKYIISGGNLQTEGILPKSWHYDVKDMRYLKAIHKKFGTKPLSKFPLFDYKAETYYKLYYGIRTIYLLNHVSYSKKEAMDYLKKNLNWQYYGGKHYESKYTKFVQSYILPEKFGIDYRKATFSAQICTNEISRDCALKKLEEPVYDVSAIDEEKEYVLKKLEISEEEFQRIMNLPCKTYKDYPNDKKKLEFVYRTYKRIYK